MKTKNKKLQKKLPHEITLNLTLKEQGRNLGGFRQEWISATQGKRKINLHSGAGLANPYLFFNLEDENGKKYRYLADVSQLITQFNERKSELQISNF